MQGNAVSPGSTPKVSRLHPQSLPAPPPKPPDLSRIRPGQPSADAQKAHLESALPPPPGPVGNQPSTPFRGGLRQRALPLARGGGAERVSPAPAAASLRKPPPPARPPASQARTEADAACKSQDTMATTIAPRTDSPGTDVFATRHGAFVVRSDLGCFLQALDFRSGHETKVSELHPACRGGDHYVGDPSSSAIYLLRGDVFFRVLDLNSEPPTSAVPLHPSCRGGDHYTFCEDRFFIFFLTRGIVLSVADLATGNSAKETCLEPAFREGLYYYGSDATHLACFKMDAENGVCGHLRSTAGHEEVFSIHPDVISFLPGGLAVVYGPSFGVWECLKLISNATDLPVPSSHEITRKVGYAKMALSQKFSLSGSLDPESLTISLLQAQFSLPAACGGIGLRTDQEEWEEVAEEDEPLRVILQPRQKLYWWQYCLGLGKEIIFFCHSLRVTRNPSPPTHIPLPLAES